MDPIIQPAADALGQMIFLMGGVFALAILVPTAFALVRLLTRP